MHVQICSTSLLFRKIKIKSSWHTTFTRLAITKKSENNKCWWGCGETKTLIQWSWLCSSKTWFRQTEIWPLPMAIVCCSFSGGNFFLPRLTYHRWWQSLTLGLNHRYCCSLCTWLSYPSCLGAVSILRFFCTTFNLMNICLKPCRLWCLKIQKDD